MLDRRRLLLGLGGGAVAVLFAGCGLKESGTAAGSVTTTSAAGSGTSTSTTSAAPTSTTSTTSTTASADTNLTAVPEETAGPYPGDGSNGVDVLTQDGIVRSDIRSSFGAGSKTAVGVPITLQLKVLDASTGKPLPGAAVYVWHCDNTGNYSLYASGLTNENYLRGVQVADADGVVTFQSIYPACYSGRWPHIHYEVYRSLANISKATNAIATSQLAMPDAENKAVFATSNYSGSSSNYARVSLTSDNVFSDGTTGEVPTITGTVAGYTVAMNVPVKV